jgi:HSP20 family protein
MTFRYWVPISDFRRMEETVSRQWRNIGREFSADGEHVESWAVPLDVVQEGDTIVVRASLPGIRLEEIHVTVEENTLTIRGETKTERESKEGDYLLRERRAGSFYRSLRLPDTVDTEKAQPHYEDGVLTIIFPTLEAKKAKQLKIAVGGGPKVINGKTA